MLQLMITFQLRQFVASAGRISITGMARSRQLFEAGAWDVFTRQSNRGEDEDCGISSTASRMTLVVVLKLKRSAESRIFEPHAVKAAAYRARAPEMQVAPP